MYTTLSKSKHQQGAVLVISLVFLILLTLIGVSAVTTSTLEEHMAGNMRDQNLAFEASETALRDAERWLAIYPSVANQPPAAVTSCTASPPCDVWTLNTIMNFAAGEDFTTWTAWTTQARPLDNSDPSTASPPALDAVNTKPRYVIEFLQYVADELSADVPPSGRYFYRITSRGTGGSDAARAFVQSVYSARF